MFTTCRRTTATALSLLATATLAVALSAPTAHADRIDAGSGYAAHRTADAVDIGKTIHPHPTLGESIGMAAEVAHGTCTDVPPQRR